MTKTLVGTPDPFDYVKAAATYRREHRSLLTSVAIALRNASRLRGRRG